MASKQRDTSADIRSVLTLHSRFRYNFEPVFFVVTDQGMSNVRVSPCDDEVLEATNSKW
jgi:hypothetical protein